MIKTEIKMAQDHIIDSSLLKEINNLSVPEKILLVENIWDSIVLSNTKLSVTLEQKRELDKRESDFNENPDDGISWQEVRRKIESGL